MIDGRFAAGKVPDWHREERESARESIIDFDFKRKLPTHSPMELS